ncbi:MAG: hypothetical protein M1540_05845 [Candidatus Bathyarchaeota archaeon]|nr:hypothetical protein [Candidatus Bathyarchaeota archaeon]
MPSQPNSNRGTLILLAPNAKDANISAANSYFVFQYNPEKLVHTFNPSIPTGNTAVDAQAPSLELFNLTFELDSTDLEPQAQNKTATDLGIHPALAMLEAMVQPQVAANKMSLPIVVFKWGAKRVVAVRVVGLSVEETAFDVSLNPTRATVNLTLRVLDGAEVNSHLGARGVYANQQAVHATLVDAYKLQTGQAPSTGKVTGASATVASTAAAKAKESKTKISA